MFRKILIGSAVIIGLLIALIGIFIAVSYTPDIPLAELEKKYATGASKFVEVNGQRVHYRDEGLPTDSIPIVLIHGTSASLLTWEGTTKLLKQEHRIIRFDLMGFALTGPSAKEDYSIAAYVTFVTDVLNKLNVKRCILVGNSLGGQIAWHVAAEHPALVSKLILVDPAGYPQKVTSLAFRLGRIPVLNTVLKIVTPTNVIRQSLEQAYFNKSLVTDSLVGLYKDMACRAGNRAALVKRLNETYVPDTQKVKQITAPTLLVWGENDFLIPVAHAEKYRRDVPIIDIKILKNMGHVPMEENPALFVKTINPYIQKK